jgi:hypothetical protein
LVVFLSVEYLLFCLQRIKTFYYFSIISSSQQTFYIGQLMNSPGQFICLVYSFLEVLKVAMSSYIPEYSFIPLIIIMQGSNHSLPSWIMCQFNFIIACLCSHQLTIFNPLLSTLLFNVVNQHLSRWMP